MSTNNTTKKVSTKYLDDLWRRLCTCKLSDFGSLIKANSGGVAPRSNDLTISEFVAACNKIGVTTKRPDVTIEDVIWSCIVPHCNRSESSTCMISKENLGDFEAKFGPIVSHGFNRAATLLTHISTTISGDDVILKSKSGYKEGLAEHSSPNINQECYLVNWFLPVAHLHIKDYEQRLINKGVESTCYGRFPTDSESAEGSCVVITVSSLQNEKELQTNNIHIGCCEKGFFVLQTNITNERGKILPPPKQMFDDYRLELGGLFEHLLLSGVASRIFVRETANDWPGQPHVPANEINTSKNGSTRKDSTVGGLFSSMLSFGCCTSERSKSKALEGESIKR